MWMTAQGMHNFSGKLLWCQRNVENLQQPFFKVTLADNLVWGWGRGYSASGWYWENTPGLRTDSPDSAAWNTGLPEKKGNNIHLLPLPWDPGLLPVRNWAMLAVKKVSISCPPARSLFPNPENNQIEHSYLRSCIWEPWAEGKSTSGNR